MTPIVTAMDVTKRYGDFAALQDVSFTIEPGSIVGLIGPNGAGKTTTLKSVLGLTDFEGEMDVLGRDPRKGRHDVMERVCFVADVGVLPRWLRVSDAETYVAGVHPRFNRQRFSDLLADTRILWRDVLSSLNKTLSVILLISIWDAPWMDCIKKVRARC